MDDMLPNPGSDCGARHDAAMPPAPAHLLNNYILMEVVLEIARSSEDPQRQLAELFDRVNARARLGGVSGEGQGGMRQFRKMAESFFVLAGRTVEMEACGRAAS